MHIRPIRHSYFSALSLWPLSFRSGAKNNCHRRTVLVVKLTHCFPFAYIILCGLKIAAVLFHLHWKLYQVLPTSRISRTLHPGIWRICPLLLHLALRAIVWQTLECLGLLPRNQTQSHLPIFWNKTFSPPFSADWKTCSLTSDTVNTNSLKQKGCRTENHCDYI
jgi:hypothetical protein